MKAYKKIKQTSFFSIFENSLRIFETHSLNIILKLFPVF